MKEIIRNVLDDLSDSQINLASETARETTTNLIVSALKAQGYNNRESVNSYFTSDFDEDKVKEDWICDYCGESTYEVEYDYLASQTRHLKCQLEYEGENGERYTDDSEQDEKYWLRTQAYAEYSSDGLPEGGDKQAVEDAHRLAEEIVEAQEGTWIYESPDGGETVFRRPFGDYDPKNKEHIDWETKKPTGKTFLDYPWHMEKEK